MFSVKEQRMPAAALEFLPFHRASIGPAEINAVVDVLQSGWLTTGLRAKEFEAAFARFIGAAHTVAVNSCTAALHLALASIGITEGDEVILPTMTFSSTSQVVLYFKAKPVLVDSRKDFFHMDPQQIERAITPRTRAILPVHYAGIPCDMDQILDVARRRGLRVIEDAAHALPTLYNGKLIGNFGDITCFSFYATKTVTAGEGGMIVTNNPEYADRARMLSSHGISRDAWKRYSAEGTWRYEILDVGFKYNLTDLAAALGLIQLAKCEALRARRAAIADRYTQALATMDAFDAPLVPDDIQHAWHLYVIKVNSALLRIGRDRVIQELQRRGIGTSVHYIPLHLHPLYQNRLGYRTGQFPNAESHFENAISLPIYPDMTPEEADRVLNTLDDIAREYCA
jgi:perosamine synthetase